MHILEVEYEIPQKRSLRFHGGLYSQDSSGESNKVDFALWL